jgi:hypothetical protein
MLAYADIEANVVQRGGVVLFDQMLRQCTCCQTQKQHRLYCSHLLLLLLLLQMLLLMPKLQQIRQEEARRLCKGPRP